MKGPDWYSRESGLSVFIVGSQGHGLTDGRECSLFQPGQHRAWPEGP